MKSTIIGALSVAASVNAFGDVGNCPDIKLVSTYQSTNPTEISAVDIINQQMVTAAVGVIEIISIADPTAPVLRQQIDIQSQFGAFEVTSCEVANGIAACSLRSTETSTPGMVVFLDSNGNVVNTVEVGILPDAMTFTSDYSKLVVANEAEPSDDYTVDPEGSATIIDLSGGVAEASAHHVSFAGLEAPEGVRVYGPGSSLAQDLEPEYVAISADDATAWVICQENNAVVEVDLGTYAAVSIKPLAYISWDSLYRDTSDKDDGINLELYSRIRGMSQPDHVKGFTVGGVQYYVSANEGDARDYEGFSEEARVADLILDASVFPDAAAIQTDDVLGRLKCTTVNGDIDNDGDYDYIQAFGTRSFTVFNEDFSEVVFDSGDHFELIQADDAPEMFNANWEGPGFSFDTDPDAFDFDARSDDKAMEPEGLEVAYGPNGDPFAFVGFERAGGGFLTYNLSDPASPVFCGYTRTDGDVAPEGLRFFLYSGRHMMAVTNEVSSTISIYEMS